MYNNETDHSLVAAFRDEKTRETAFTQLVRKYQERLYWHIRRLVVQHEDTNDILQNMFIKVWQNLGNFREEANLYTWLYRIATNECLNFLKSKKRKFFLPINDVEAELSAKIDRQENLSGDEIQLKLQKALLKLPDKQRLVFNMKYYDEMTYEQISEILGTSVGALKASYHLAVKKIEDYVTKD